MKKILALVLIGMIFSNYIILESNAEIVVKKSDEIRCTNVYEKFVKMGEDGFRKRYPAYPIMDKCMSLFHNPEWNFNGKDLIDQRYYNIFYFQKDSNETNHILNSKIISKTKIGSEKFLIKFNICSENKPSNYLQITTDKEQIIGKIHRPITGSCPLFLVQINSNIPENTEFSWYYDSLEKSQKTREVLFYAKR